MRFPDQTFVLLQYISSKNLSLLKKIIIKTLVFFVFFLAACYLLMTFHVAGWSFCALASDCKPAPLHKRFISSSQPPQTQPSKRLWHVSTLLVSLQEIPGGVRCSWTWHGAFVAMDIFHVRMELCLCLAGVNGAGCCLVWKLGYFRCNGSPCARPAPPSHHHGSFMLPALFSFLGESSQDTKCAS